MEQTLLLFPSYAILALVGGMLPPTLMAGLPYTANALELTSQPHPDEALAS